MNNHNRLAGKTAQDGLYKMIARNEAAIRADLIGQNSKIKILQKVSGALTGKSLGDC